MQSISVRDRTALLDIFERRLPLFSAFFLVLGMLAFPFDQWVASRFTLAYLPGDIEGAINRAEVFGHGTGVLAIIFTFWLLRRPNGRTLTLLVMCSFGAGFWTNLVKMSVGRIRPHSLVEHAHVETMNSFVGVFPLVTRDWSDAFNSAFQSFPSSHTATAFGLALCLGHFYPRARYWFLFLAALVGLQRIGVHAHYVSDVFCGASVSLTWNWWLLKKHCLSVRQLGMENRSSTLDHPASLPQKAA